MNLRKFIPSMFHRRVILLGGACSALLCICFAKAVHLTVVRGDEMLAKAERALDRREYLPTTRGTILDRRGRKIAIDKASYDLAVEYEVITGEWAVNQATAAARAETDEWRQLTLEQRADLIEPHLAGFREIEQIVWRRIRDAGGVSQIEIDERCNQIKTVVERRASFLWEQQRRREIEQYGSLRPDFEPMRIAEREQPHVILTRVDDETAFELMALGREYPDMIEIQDSHRRHHPWSTRTYTIDRSSLPRSLQSDRPLAIEVRGVGDHILGSVRDEVWAEDIANRPFYLPESGEINLTGYRIGDAVGHSGLERTFEDTLRGARGMITERKDTGERHRTEPRPGGSLELAIDIELQGRIQAVLDPELGLTRVQSWHQNPALPVGWKLNAAVVVMDVASGEILALVSTPSITDGLDMSPRLQQQNTPRVNRAVEAIYPPGSIVKPLVLAAAVSDGVHDLDVPIECNGQFYEHHANFARCWIYREKYGFRTHGPLHASEAIGRSCNIYFYHMADKLGVDRLKSWLHWFGMGRLLDIGLTRELAIEDDQGDVMHHIVGGSAGVLPSEERIAQMAAEGSLQSGTIFMGIGQGPIAWTPLHAANAYAMLARGGEVLPPVLVRGYTSTSASPASRMLPNDLIDAALEGLRQSAEEHHGTGNHLSYEDGTFEPIINAPGVMCWAKTGTAQAPVLQADIDGDGTISRVRNEAGVVVDVEGIAGVDHAWYVGLVGPEGEGEPTIAISVLVEYGGSGGRCAGPVANQVIRALQVHGYLPGRDLWEDGDVASP